MVSGWVSRLVYLKAAVDSRQGLLALYLIRRKSIAVKGALQRDDYGLVVGVISNGGGAVLMLVARSKLLIYCR